MTEPDVALTDFALAAECAVFSVILLPRSTRANELAPWMLLYFATMGVASLCGGLVHGFYLDTSTWGHAILWPATLLAIGLNALAVWAVGAKLLFSPRVAGRFIVLGLVATIIYSILVLWGYRNFMIAVAITVPAALFVLAAFVVMYRRNYRSEALLAAAGVLTTMAAALVQQLRISVHPLYFNHNATAHVVQAVALVLFFVAGKQFLDSTAGALDRSA